MPQGCFSVLHIVMTGHSGSCTGHLLSAAAAGEEDSASNKGLGCYKTIDMGFCAGEGQRVLAAGGAAPAG